MDLQETHMLGHMRNSDGQELISQQALKSLGKLSLQLLMVRSWPKMFITCRLN